MKNKLTMDERKDKIRNCGKSRHFDRQRDTSWKAVVEYCGYHSGEERCEKCRAYRASVLAAQVTKNLMSAERLFRCVINDELDWRRLQKKITKEQITFQRQPVAGGSAIVIVTEDPGHRDFNFVEVSALAAIAELTTDEALFSEGAGKIRSSSRDWPLTPKDEPQQAEDGVWLKVFEPRFKPSTGEFKTPYEDLFRLLPACNTWSHGDPADNPQLYMTVNSSTLVEMGIAVGYEPDLDKTVVTEQFYTFDEIKKWKAQSYKKAEHEFYGETEFGEAYNKHNFYGRHEQLLKVIQGNTDIPNWLEIIEEYKSAQKEQHEIDKLVREYTETYRRNDMLFGMMYGEDKLQQVTAYLRSQTEVEQRQLDRDLPY